MYIYIQEQYPILQYIYIYIYIDKDLYIDR